MHRGGLGPAHDAKHTDESAWSDHPAVHPPQRTRRMRHPAVLVVSADEVEIQSQSPPVPAPQTYLFMAAIW